MASTSRNIEEIPNRIDPIPPPPEQETLENQNSDVLLDQKTSDSSNKGEDDEEEEAECGFCLYMKGGGCKDSFIAWEKCMEEAEESKEDVVEKCFQVTLSLKNCMEAHPDYYEPILRAEKAGEQQVTKGMQESKEIEIEIEIENEPEMQNKIEEAVKQPDSESVVAEKEDQVVVKEVELNNKVAEEEETKNPVMAFFEKVFSFKF